MGRGELVASQRRSLFHAIWAHGLELAAYAIFAGIYLGFMAHSTSSRYTTGMLTLIIVGPVITAVRISRTMLGKG